MSLFLSMNAFAFSVILYIITNKPKYVPDNWDKVLITILIVGNLILGYAYGNR